VGGVDQVGVSIERFRDLSARNANERQIRRMRLGDWRSRLFEEEAVKKEDRDMTRG
jgi:hypothetical protein